MRHIEEHAALITTRKSDRSFHGKSFFPGFADLGVRHSLVFSVVVSSLTSEDL